MELLQYARRMWAGVLAAAAEADGGARHGNATRPDYVVVLPWNLFAEISEQLGYVAEWGGRLIVPIPFAKVVEPGARSSAVRA